MEVYLWLRRNPCVFHIGGFIAGNRLDHLLVLLGLRLNLKLIVGLLLLTTGGTASNGGKGKDRQQAQGS